MLFTDNGNKKHQWTNSISSVSSSRSSSITSDSSDGHFDIRHFPLPKPSLSATEVQKQRESHQAYNSSVGSYTASSWSSNHLVDLPGYDPNRIPSSVFSSKPANSTEWSIASNESLFSIHDGNFGISTRDDHGLFATLRLAEIPRLEETVHQIAEINPVPPSPPPIKKPNESEKETIAEDEAYRGEISDSEIDEEEEEEEDEEDIIELESNNEHEEEEEEEDKGENIIEEEVSVEIDRKSLEEKQVTQVVTKNKPEDSNSIVSHSPSTSCRSDTSNNSIGSFAFPVLQKDDAVIKTPSMKIKENIYDKRRLEYQQPQSPMLQPKPQPQPDTESSTLTHLQPQSQPQHKASKQFESPKALKGGWFSCFHCPSKCSLFK